MKCRSRRLCLQTVSRPDFDCLGLERKGLVYIPAVDIAKKRKIVKLKLTSASESILIYTRSNTVVVDLKLLCVNFSVVSSLMHERLMFRRRL